MLEDKTENKPSTFEVQEINFSSELHDLILALREKNVLHFYGLSGSGRLFYGSENAHYAVIEQQNITEKPTESKQDCRSKWCDGSNYSGGKTAT
jgi:ABC-type sugar transport system ATPase subunit